jgi:hypothetical protein
MVKARSPRIGVFALVAKKKTGSCPAIQVRGRLFSDHAFKKAQLCDSAVSPVSQMLICRVSGIRNNESTKHTAGTAIG